MATFLVTSGPTREPIDPVRYLSNASTGRMGNAIAEAALSRGHNVDLVTGPVELPSPTGVREHRVVTTLEMLRTCEKLYPTCDVLIGAAAVSDYRPREVSPRKKTRNNAMWTLELEANPDILARLGQCKQSQLHVGFALEDGDDPVKALQRARDKLQRKNLDWIVLNFTSAIGADAGEFYLVSAAEERFLGVCTKRSLATTLVELLS